MHFRAAFVSDLLNALEREQGASVHARLRARLPERIAARLPSDESRSNGYADLIPLEDAEELLLAIDGALGDGSGRVLETAALELFSRTLSRDAGVVIAGDLFATVARMRTPFEHPFVGVPPLFELAATDTGFSLTVGVVGRPRTAKVLRGVAGGMIRAAARFSREAATSELKLSAETLGDRASVVASYRQSATAEPEAMPPTSQASRRPRVTQPRLSLEVERILSRPPPSAASDPSGSQHTPVRPHRPDNQEDEQPKRSRR